MSIESQPIQTLSSAVSLAASVNSNAGNVSQVLGYSIQAIISGGTSPTGTLKLQYSNDGTNWDDISGATWSVTDNGNRMFNQSGVYYNYVRAVYTRTSGTGNLSLVLVSKA